MVAKKWTAPIMDCLSTGDKRPTELMNQIGGVSQKMLTQTLRQMEACRLVARQVHAVVPPRVDYGLTPLGSSLLEVLRPLNQWINDHADKVLETEERPMVNKKPRRQARLSQAEGTEIAPES